MRDGYARGMCGVNQGGRTAVSFDPARIRAVIYDCDGVLVDSVESNRAYYNHILARFGLPAVTQSQMELVLTGTGKSVLEALFEGSPFAEAAREFQLQMPADIFLDLVKPEPHVHEVLRQLRTGGCRTAVATNRGKSLVPLLEMLGMRDLFDILVSSNDVTRNKPDPECLFIVLKRFGLAPDAVLYIGDSDVDRETAARAGTPFAAYRNASLKADLHLCSHTDLVKVLVPGC